MLPRDEAGRHRHFLGADGCKRRKDLESAARDAASGNRAHLRAYARAPLWPRLPEAVGEPRIRRRRDPVLAGRERPPPLGGGEGLRRQEDRRELAAREAA